MGIFFVRRIRLKGIYAKAFSASGGGGGAWASVSWFIIARE